MAQEAFSSDTQGFVLKLDEAAQAHMAWTRRVLRCAVLRSSPGDDVLADDAHMRCGLGKWFRQYREQFDVIDTISAQRLDEQHRQMHDAVRCICTRILDGVAGDAGVLDAFERTQASVIAELSHLKTECLAHSARLDALTGLPLRHGLEDDFRRYRAQAVRRNELLVLVLWDVDHFKRVNDVHGHPAGDLALQHVANSLRLHCRDGEPLFRYRRAKQSRHSLRRPSPQVEAAPE
jgi:GGDEF domain-containing protein